MRFNVISGGARANAVAFGCDGRIPGADGAPIDASFKLERNVWNGVVEPRLILQHGAPCAPLRRSSSSVKPDDYLTTVLMELDRDLDDAHEDDPDVSERIRASASGRSGPASERTVFDWRGRSPLATIADAQAASGS